MKSYFLSFLFLLPFLAIGQEDSLFSSKVKQVLEGFTNNFESFIDIKKISGVPKRVFVEPGLLGTYDELHIWGDTTFIYSSSNITEDSSLAKVLINSLDEKLTSILGEKFIRKPHEIKYAEENEIALEYKSKGIEIIVMVGKLYQKGFMTILAFRGSISTSK